MDGAARRVVLVGSLRRGGWARGAATAPDPGPCFMTRRLGCLRRPSPTRRLSGALRRAGFVSESQWVHYAAADSTACSRASWSSRTRRPSGLRVTTARREGPDRGCSSRSGPRCHVAVTWMSPAAQPDSDAPSKWNTTARRVRLGFLVGSLRRGGYLGSGWTSTTRRLSGIATARREGPDRGYSSRPGPGFRVAATRMFPAAQPGMCCQ